MALFKPRPTKIARTLRNNATPAEKLLWRHLSGRQLAGFKFSRQMPVAGYVTDFMCREARLIIELDGGQHALAVERDEIRTKAIETEGFRVIRFWNNDVLERTEGVLLEIKRVLGPCPPPAPPACGRGGL
ncbi:endonuclease domain-containing protein [Allosphingosinicella flava]|uniref:Endonuclease domain-containing protein n=1 Tax=Allosphingosinicella flava TaxID=2771430 RepID=A0A7T2GKZ5_9SPHN|nr:DUF559 domain-containing protein [Sphingosinicella flava]QPQ55752.1 endonuclease domain-containing protein [Sphingosinicella flava]